MATLRLDALGPAAARLLRLVVAAGAADAVLVGGLVRDARLGRVRRDRLDLDLAVPGGALALARRIAERARGTLVPLDDERGTARIVLGAGRIDVADFRAPTLDGDLAKRDFTVNALAVPIRALLRAGRATIVDPTGGLADLRARRLRLHDRRVLDDDPLRGLRGIRLEATLGLRLTPPSARAIKAAAPRLARVAVERVREELLELLKLPHSARALRRADALGVLAVVLPEVEPMRATSQPAPHRFPVLEHSLRAVAGADQVVARPSDLSPFGEELEAHLAASLGGGVTRGQALKLAALLHDVAKPETRRAIGGRVRFFEHDLIGAARVRAIGERLRLPAATTALVERLVRHHLRPMHLAAADAVTPRARYRFYRDLGPDTRDLLLLVLVDAAAVTGDPPRSVWRKATLLRDLLAGWAEQQEVAAAPPLLRGDDVMHHFALAPGPEVGRLLRRAREAQDLGRVTTRDDALAYLDSSRRRS